MKLLQQSKDTFEVDREKAFLYANQAFAVGTDSQDDLGLVKSLIQLGRLYSSEKKYFKCIECFYSALTITDRNNFLLEKGVILEALAYQYIELQKYERATELIDEALTVAERLSDINQKTQLLLDQGRVFYETGKYNLALRNYFYILNFRDSITDSRIIMNSFRGLGTVFFYLKKYPWALHYFQSSVKECLKNGLKWDLGSIYTLIAHVYQTINSPDSSLHYNMLALEVREKTLLTDHKASSLLNIGNLLLDRGELDQASKYINQGIALLSNSEDYNLIAYAYRQLTRLYIEQNDYPKAFEAIENLYAAEDRLVLAKNRGEVERLEANYWISEIEAEKNLLKKEIEIQHLQIENKSYSEFILQLVLILVFLIIIFFFYHYYRSLRTKDSLLRINSKLDHEIRDRINTEVQLRTSEELYRFVTEHTLDLIVRMDRNFNYLYISPSIRRMFGYGAEETNIPAVKNLIPEMFHEDLRIQYLEMVRLKEPVMLTHQSERKDKSLFWAESLVNPIFDEKTGKLKETITVIRDITDRVAYEESLSENSRQKELLLREIHHRVKNNFAILVSLMNMQKVSSHPGDFKEFLTELQGRIRTMSLVHELLYRSYDIDYIHFGDYMGQLISIIARAYNNNPVKIHTSIETCILDVETALPLGLISNEILTNAYKYAFNDQQEGELWIDVKRYYDESDQNGNYSHTLTIRDNGPGLPEGFSPENLKTMGSQIITLLVDQLEGRLDVSGTDGATFTIYFSDEKRS
ncbi:histidine kinase dimerization/phosphoacceptor domain -containing protein [Bacteroidota bacterium]